MAGQLIQRGERKWVVRVFLGRDSQTGKRRYHNHTVNGNKKDAQKYLNGVLRELDLGVFVEPSKMELNQYLDHWLEITAKPRVTRRVLSDYKDLLRLHVRNEIGNKKLSDVRPLDIQAIHTKMIERGLSAKTVRFTHAVLSSALKQAVKWRMLPQNPAQFVDLPKGTRKEMKALSPEDAAAFLRAAAQDRWAVLFAFALTTGMRPEEYLGLQWKDIDLQTGIVTVQRALIWQSKVGWYFSEPKTARSRRSIPLARYIVEALVGHRRRQAEERLKAGAAYQNHDLVFATGEGTPILRRNLVRRHFKPILKMAGLDQSIRLYDLRHSCATLLLSENVNPKVVSERLGHASITITMDTYSHVLPSMQQAASEKLEEMLFRKTGTQ
jgi:integrase